MAGRPETKVVFILSETELVGVAGLSENRLYSSEFDGCIWFIIIFYIEMGHFGCHCLDPMWGVPQFQSIRPGCPRCPRHSTRMGAKHR